MRSVFYTFFLLLLAAVLGVGSIIHFSQGNLHRFFGVPATAEGDKIYGNFKPSDVKNIAISTNGASVYITNHDGYWEMTKPVVDRADPRYVKTLLDFTLTTRSADVFENHLITDAQSGLKDGMINVKVTDQNRQNLAKFILGRQAAWQYYDEERKEYLTTYFLQTDDAGRRTHTYAATSFTPKFRDIFNDGMKFFRDHHPFLFAPSKLKKIRVNHAGSEFTLERINLESNWIISKPQQLDTDADAMKKLIEGLVELSAVSLSDKDQVTLPATPLHEITIESFTNAAPVTLTIYPAENQQCLATISDRPNTIFHLPYVPQANLLGLSELPLASFNELRAKTFTAVNIATLKSIRLAAANVPPILLHKPRPDAWHIYITENVSIPVNEETMFQLLKLLNETKVKTFLTDTAYLTNADATLAKYGLDRPALSITAAYINNQSYTIKCGLAKDGSVTAQLDSPETRNTIVQLPDDFLRRIPLSLEQWRDTLLLSVPAVDLTAIDRDIPEKLRLHADYDYLNEAWKIKINGEDKPNTEVLTVNANNFLKSLAKLKVKAWLAPDDAAALAALKKPAMTLTITSQNSDDGEQSNTANVHTLTIARSPDSTQFYGSLSSQTSLFFLDLPTVKALAADLVSE